MRPASSGVYPYGQRTEHTLKLFCEKIAVLSYRTPLFGGDYGILRGSYGVESDLR